MPAKTTAKNKRSIQAKTLSKVKVKKPIKTKHTSKAEVSEPKKKRPASKIAGPAKLLSKSGEQKSKNKSTSQTEKKSKKKPEPISKAKPSSAKKETQKNSARSLSSNRQKAVPTKSVSDRLAIKRISKPKETVEKKSGKTVNTKSNLAKTEQASRTTKPSESASFVERFKITNLSQVLEPSLEVLGIKPYQQKRNEEYMGVAMYDHFYRILMAHRQLLLEGGDRIVRHMQEDAVNYADPNDRASQEEDFRLELRTRDRERKLLKKIEESLELIREKEYGYCEVCGVEIGLPRLEARPTATLCIDCKTLDEIKEKQQRQDDEY